VNIYVGNLPFRITEEELKEAFEEFGRVNKAAIIKDKASGQSKGFGFVDMPDKSEAERAIKSLDGSSMKGRTIKVNEAKPRDNDRPPRPTKPYS
jgi:RNA recognition motif-containing protein